MHKRVKREKPVKIENEQKGGRSGEAAGRVWRPPVVGGSPRRSKLLSHFQLEMKKKLTTKSEGGDENMCENCFGRKNKQKQNRYRFCTISGSWPFATWGIEGGGFESTLIFGPNIQKTSSIAGKGTIMSWLHLRLCAIVQSLPHCRALFMSCSTTRPRLSSGTQLRLEQNLSTSYILSTLILTRFDNFFA